jgi:hypothetical protein
MSCMARGGHHHRRRHQHGHCGNMTWAQIIIGALGDGREVFENVAIICADRSGKNDFPEPTGRNCRRLVDIHVWNFNLSN